MKSTDAEEVIEELKAALSELESDYGLVRFVEGHGLQSRVFAFSWSSDKLDISFRIPYARVLSDEESQARDNARIGVAIRLAILLLASIDEGTLLGEGEEKLIISADDDGESYSIVNADGESVDSGDDWESLVARIDASIPDGSVEIIWP